MKLSLRFNIIHGHREIIVTTVKKSKTNHAFCFVLHDVPCVLYDNVFCAEKTPTTTIDGGKPDCTRATPKSAVHERLRT